MRTLNIDTITGQITIDGIGDVDTLDPWGAEEEDMARADDAVTGMGYARTTDWQRNPLNDNLWTCTIAHPSELASVTVTIGATSTTVIGLKAAAEIINEHAQRYPGEYAAYASTDLLGCAAYTCTGAGITRRTYTVTIGGQQVTATWTER